ncbi:hypothetical protein [Brevibacterium sp. CT2-23B]|uniref:hypothetical protein n=1 Tax=Brevibacterium sp. CT2-23B TaxID=2729630 RepID=UPI0015577406|nr:hypothetical protein [Brevibacterium sp. CT2-23B]
MIEIDVTDPQLSWDDYTADELVHAQLITPRVDGVNITSADMELKAQAESALREYLSAEDEDRRIRVLWHRAKDTLDNAREAMTSMDSIRANIKTMQGAKPVPLNLKPKLNVDMDKVLRSMTNQLSHQLRVKIAPDGTLTSIPIDSEEKVAPEPELSDSEQEQLREVQQIADSPSMLAIVNYLEDMSTRLVEGEKQAEQRRRIDSKFRWASIGIAALSLIIATLTAATTFFGPTPTVQFPDKPVPVIIERSTK